MAEAKLLISSRNYSSWSLRGWLLARLSGLPFREEVVSPDDPSARAELLLQSSSIRVPCLIHDGLEIWDTLAIAEYLHEIRPEARMYPEERPARALCRAVSGEMHSGFAALRSSLPQNLRARVPGFRVWSSAQADIDRITAIWRECLDRSGGPYLFGDRLTVADAMYAPVVMRFVTYDVTLHRDVQSYGRAIREWPDLTRWVEEARREPETISELELASDF